MCRLGFWVVLVLLVPAAQAQVDNGQADTVQVDTAQTDMEPVNTAQTYVGIAASTIADEGTPTLGVQFGVGVLERLGVRGVLESNFSNLLVSAEGLYHLSPTDALGQPYVGGGVTATGLTSVASGTPVTTIVTLPTLTGGYAYRFGVLSVFGELRLLVFLPFPTPELRAGVNVYF